MLQTLTDSGREGEERRYVALSDPTAAAAFVRREPVDAVIVDTRSLPARADTDNPSLDGPFGMTRAGHFLALLF
ncbi:MAG: hypothetical protein DRJ42_27485, partial [Deltaproteobacteria bacterium]